MDAAVGYSAAHRCGSLEVEILFGLKFTSDVIKEQQVPDGQRSSLLLLIATLRAT